MKLLKQLEQQKTTRPSDTNVCYKLGRSGAVLRAFQNLGATAVKALILAISVPNDRLYFGGMKKFIWDVFILIRNSKVMKNVIFWHRNLPTQSSREEDNTCPRGQAHRKLPSVFTHWPPLQRRGLRSHSSMSEKKFELNKVGQYTATAHWWYLVPAQLWHCKLQIWNFIGLPLGQPTRWREWECIENYFWPSNWFAWTLFPDVTYFSFMS